MVGWKETTVSEENNVEWIMKSFVQIILLLLAMFYFKDMPQNQLVYKH